MLLRLFFFTNYLLKQLLKNSVEQPEKGEGQR
jgi:hypothetical protein